MNKETERGKFDSEPLITKCFSEDFAKGIYIFRILTENIDFSQPFRMVIDYDPEQPRVKTELHMPTEVLEQYIQKVQGNPKE